MQELRQFNYPSIRRSTHPQCASRALIRAISSTTFKRLGHIIIGSCFQTLHHISGIGFGGEHDNRCIGGLPYAVCHLHPHPIPEA